MQRSGCSRAAALAALLLAAGAANAQGIVVMPEPVELTPVTGTRTMFQPDAWVANFDAGDMVAGTTWWQHPSLGIVWIETSVGFLWTPGAGSVVFEIPANVYLNDNWQHPAEIADDGTVVGTNTFTQTLQTFPFQWTSEAGFQLLEPPASGWLGSAGAVSRDGEVVAGEVHPGVFGVPRAARWVSGAIELVGPPRTYSIGNDLSDDGAVMVGAIGPSQAGAQATRWVDGVETGLAPVPGATASSAEYVSADGQVAIGRATIGGIEALVRWELGDPPTVHAPPFGLSLENLNAIDPTASLAVGALSDQVPFDEDWTPFVWSRTGGFTLIEELGDPGDYELAQATDVSDDGQRVIGQLQSSVVFNGEPPTLAFLWTPTLGTRSLDEVLASSGQASPGLYDAIAISADGRRILAVGGPRPTIHDTNAMIVELGAELLEKP